MSQTYEKSPVREYFESIVIAVILALFVRTFVVQAFKIPSGSMEDNLLVGDHLLVNKFIFGGAPTALERAVLPIRDIHRGDVIVFKYPGEPGPRLHQADHRPAGRDGGDPRQGRLHQRRAARRVRYHLKFKPRAGGCAARPEGAQLRAGDGAGRPPTS